MVEYDHYRWYRAQPVSLHICSKVPVRYIERQKRMMLDYEVERSFVLRPFGCAFEVILEGAYENFTYKGYSASIFEHCLSRTGVI